MTIQDVLSDLGIDYREEGNHHCRPGWLQVCCPWCDRGAHKYHLGCNLALKYWNCWRCGGHSMFSVLVQLGLARERAQEYARTLDTSRALKRERARVCVKIPRGIGELQPVHREYLLSRNFDADQLARIWKIQGIGIHARLSWRLFIPIEKNEILVSWTTRSLNDKGLRYISASAEEESENHKDLLYGADYCSHSIVICEGPFDVWRIGPGAVATFGTSFTEIQIAEMVRFPYRFICFDNEPAAQQQARDLAASLSVFPGQTTNLQLDAKDPGEASTHEISQVRKIARL